VGGARFDVLEKFAVVTGAVGAKVLEDGGERCVGHGDLEEIVTEWDLLLLVD